MAHAATKPLAPPRRRPPRALTVVRDPSEDELDATIDWSAWYLTEEDDVGQSPEQDDVVDVFASSVQEHVRAREGARVRVGRDAFFAWLEQEPNVRVSPDVYVLDRPPEPPWPRMWQTWRVGHAPPRFALEVVSADDWKKDYEQVPAKYALLGARELVIFDPEAARGVAPGPRVALQVYRREADGSFVRVYVGAGPARVETLGAWVVARASGGVGWLRLTRDGQGEDVVLTARERAEQERERAEQERERAEQERERAEQERERAELAERQLRELKDELERLKRTGGRGPS
jgi:Uma2 family endonuclease